MLLVVLWEVQNSTVVDRMSDFTTNDAKLHFGVIPSEIATEFDAVAFHVSRSSTVRADNRSFQDAAIKSMTASATNSAVQRCRSGTSSTYGNGDEGRKRVDIDGISDGAG